MPTAARASARNHSGTHLVHAALAKYSRHARKTGRLAQRARPHALRLLPFRTRRYRRAPRHRATGQRRDPTQLRKSIQTSPRSTTPSHPAHWPSSATNIPTATSASSPFPTNARPRGFYSKELCGGTHVHRIGDIGVLKIIGEQSVAAGVRRIEAVTGIGALEHFQQQAQILTTSRQQAQRRRRRRSIHRGKALPSRQTTRKRAEIAKAQRRPQQSRRTHRRAQTIKGTKLISEEVGNVDREGLRQLVDSLRQKLGSGVVVLGMPEDGKVVLIAGVTKDLTGKVHAGKLIKVLAPKVGGSGGGRPDLAEAGGKDTAQLKSALQSVPSLIEPLL